jgi:hypothetical protein
MARRGDLNGWWWFGIAVVGFFWRVLFRLRSGSASRVPTGSRPRAARSGRASVGHAFKTGVGARAPRRVRFRRIQAEELEPLLGRRIHAHHLFEDGHVGQGDLGVRGARRGERRESATDVRLDGDEMATDADHGDAVDASIHGWPTLSAATDT